MLILRNLFLYMKISYEDIGEAKAECVGIIITIKTI